MVLENPLWQQANKYPARLDRQFIEDVFDVEGVIKPSSGALLVSPRAAGANMSVEIAAGRAVIKGDDEANQGSYRVISTAVETRPIGAPPGSDSRIDLVIARVRDANVTGGVSSDWVIEVIPGAVAANPVAPAVPATAIPLAQILVAAGTLSIDAPKITDRRTAATSAQYAAKGGLDRVVIPASAFTTLGGTPAQGAVNVLAALLFDAAAVEEAGTVATVPAIWATFDIMLWWTNAGAGGGNVVWRADHAVTNAGGTLTRVINAAVTLSAPAQGVVRLDTLKADVARVDFPLVHVNAVRIGSDAADTLLNDAALIAVELRRKTYA